MLKCLNRSLHRVVVVISVISILEEQVLRLPISHCEQLYGLLCVRPIIKNIIRSCRCLIQFLGVGFVYGTLLLCYKLCLENGSFTNLLYGNFPFYSTAPSDSFISAIKFKNWTLEKMN